MASVLALQCSTNWAMKTQMLGADQLIEFIFTRDRNETWNEVFRAKIYNRLNCDYNCDDHVSISDLIEIYM